MKKVILTLGPRGAGKTTFCREEILSRKPEIPFVERDAISQERFGSTSLDPYTGQSEVVRRELLDRVRKHLEQDSATVILDTWTGFADERRRLIRELRALGADRVIGWHFITSKDTVVKQFLQREKPQEWNRQRTEEHCRGDYDTYHRQSILLEQGFDRIIKINPFEVMLFPYADLLFLNLDSVE